MSNRPFMQFYVSDFVGDTLALSGEQVGAYILLLTAMWNAGGELDADEVKLARIARQTVKKWRVIGDDVLAFFDIEDGKVTHQRVTFELQKVEAKSEKRSAAGRAGVEAKRLKNKEVVQANAEPLLKHSPEPELEEESSSYEEPKKSPFETFWDVYPHKVGKRAAEASFSKALTRASFDAVMEGLALYAAKTDDRPWCNPATWLNQDRWADKPATVVPVARGSPQREPGISELAFRLAATMDQADGRQDADRKLDWETALRLPAA